MEQGKRIVIWGTGKEGRAAETFVRAHHNPASVTFVDEVASADASVITDPKAIEEAVLSADVLVKSPGVSLYHQLIAKAAHKGVHVTSLLNLWWEKRPSGKTVCITGTKGKSTTAALLAYVLGREGYKAALLGNIGVPVTEAPEGMDYLVLEMSSYQAADFKGMCDIAAVTSLYPEHLNWHGDLETYYHDKLNLLGHAKVRIVHPQVGIAWKKLPQDCIHAEDVAPEQVPNAYLQRTHNLGNVGIVLAIVRALGLDADGALAAMDDFKGLSHRQQELGEIDGIVFVDDSIATTPQAAIAAMDVYRGRPVTLIAGGYDRGIDYAPLAAHVAGGGARAVITLGPSGKRIAEGLSAKGFEGVHAVSDMAEAIAAARKLTPKGGVILLSPAAPSFGLFRDYVERGEAFARAAGF